MRAIIQLSKITLTYFNLFTVKSLSRKFHFGSVALSGIFNYVNRNCFYTSYAHVLNKVANEINNDKSKTESSPKPESTKKKKQKLTYITLIESDENVTVTTLEDATKLAVRRNLRLIKIKEYDVKSERATYQLMTTSQYLAEEKKSKIESNKNSLIKGTKLLSISSKINDHDIKAKVKNMIKWLDKQNEVRIVISNDNGEAENVYSKFVEEIKEAGRIVQKRMKGSDLKFQIVPPKIQKQTNSSSGSKSE